MVLYLCLTCFNLIILVYFNIFFGGRGHMKTRLILKLWDKNVLIEILDCFLRKWRLISFHHVLNPLWFSNRMFSCPRGPLLSNQGTPLIPSCPVRGEQYEEIFSCVHDCCSSIFFSCGCFLFSRWWSFVFLRLAEQNDAQIFFTFLRLFLLVVLLLSS